MSWPCGISILIVRVIIIAQTALRTLLLKESWDDWHKRHLPSFHAASPSTYAHLDSSARHPVMEPSDGSSDDEASP